MSREKERKTIILDAEDNFFFSNTHFFPQWDYKKEKNTIFEYANANADLVTQFREKITEELKKKSMRYVDSLK